MGIKTLNKLVGSSRYMCDPGYNPGAGYYNDTYANGVEPTSYDSASKSRFWPKLEDKDVLVGTWTGIRYIRNADNTCTRRIDTRNQYCNPVTGVCTPIRASDFPDIGNRCPCCTAGIVWPKTAAETASGVETARGLGAYYYGSQEVVSLLRATMKGILSLGGGNVEENGASLSLPAYGRKVDPTIIESACAHTGGVAYPMIDVPPTPTPLAFQSGNFGPAGDGRNIFPIEVRLSNDTASERNVARSATFELPAQTRAYTLVLRYYSDGTTAKVGLQHHISGGTLKVISNSVNLANTNSNWKLLRLNFETNYGWPHSIYARIEHRGGATAYLDATWLELR